MSERINFNSCPFCGSAHGCEHLLVAIDVTFREAINGALYSSFNKEWAAICEENGDDCDESEPFEELIDQVRELADAEQGEDFEGGPGQSFEKLSFFCETPEKTTEAVKRFSTD